MRSVFLLLLLLSLSLTSLAQENPKHVLIILADDLGWNDTSIYQDNQFYETPNIDALADRGMVFTQSFTNSPLCSPTRASLLTGQTPARHHILNPNIETSEIRLIATERSTAASNQLSAAPDTATRLDTAIPTLATIFKANNYKTAHFGKWHLGAEPFSALEHGFDVDIPHYAGSGPTSGYLAPWSFAPGLQPQAPGEHIDIRLAEEAVKWIKDNSNDGSLFINFWPFSVHAPYLSASGDYYDYFVEKRSPYNSQRSAVYAAMVKHFDDAIGILWEGLVEAGIENDTIIIFTSDNGGNMYDVLGQIHPTSNFPLRGGKATQYSGGNRVPTFVIWPGKSQPHTLSNEFIQTADIYPTLLQELGFSWPESHLVDGTNFSDALLGDSLPSRPVITYYPTQSSVPDWLPPSATIQLDNWKLIKTFYYGTTKQDMYQLYNLDTDISESTNLADIELSKLSELDLLLSDYLAGSSAALPQPNANYIEGRFNYQRLGVPGNQYVLPEEAIDKTFALHLSSSHTKAFAGDSIEISWSVSGDATDVSTNYAQFMGQSVAISPVVNGFSFSAPRVDVAEFISFAFIARKGDQVIRKQLGVEIIPVNTAPELSIKHVSRLQKGQKAVIEFSVYDVNKDILNLSVSSPALQLNNHDIDDPTLFEFTVPSTLTNNEIELTFKLTDGQEETSLTQTFEIQTSTSTPSNGSGGGAIFWLIPLSVIILAMRIKK
ncbi:sulfatase [Aestuariibacter sp. GS-14]|uniref:sulfatase n=1 Tax=Aestuariibacter sp. GS-14 TaxID=2590670 RepID=UPI00112D5E6E|nr:sulfatase [Aestuariibacter sp. GS-14]TPV58349.1 sulfatase [Aestuariibacter sp. GS-14]